MGAGASPAGRKHCHAAQGAFLHPFLGAGFAHHPSRPHPSLAQPVLWQPPCLLTMPKSAYSLVPVSVGQCQIWPAKGDTNSRGENRQTEGRSPPAQELCPWSGLPLLRFTMSISWSAAELEVAGVCPTLLNSSPALSMNLMSLLAILSIAYAVAQAPC